MHTPVATGLSFEKLYVDADDLDATTTAATATSGSSRNGKALTGVGGNGVDWQSLWGSDNIDDGIQTATDGSYLLGECWGLIRFV